MKKTNLYAVVTVAIIAVAAIAIVGCNDDFGESSEKADAFLDKFRNSRTVKKTFSVTYDGNGSNDGSAPKDIYSPYQYNALITVLSEGSLRKTGFLFNGWNDSANGKGDLTKQPKDQFRITKDVKFFAQWKDASKQSYPVKVETSRTGIGASGSKDYAPNDTVHINVETYDGCRFKNWTVTKGNVEFDDAGKPKTTFIMPEMEVKVMAIFECEGEAFTDNRDGKTYRTVTIGEQTQMAVNLNYETENNGMDSCWCYRNQPDSCNKYGRLYNWYAAMKACPTGWRLSNREDWDILADFVGGQKHEEYYDGKHKWSLAGEKLKAKSPTWDGTDDYGFSGMPGGSYFFNGFGNAGGYAIWWTATDNGGGMAYRRDICGGDCMDEYANGKSEGFSVRCLMDN